MESDELDELFDTIKYPQETDFRGNRAHYVNGVYHRDYGPALVLYDGTKFWFKNGILHREDGPAVVYTDGYVEYWLNNLKVTETEFLERTKK